MAGVGGGEITPGLGANAAETTGNIVGLKQPVAEQKSPLLDSMQHSTPVDVDRIANALLEKAASKSQSEPAQENQAPPSVGNPHLDAVLGRGENTGAKSQEGGMLGGLLDFSGTGGKIKLILGPLIFIWSWIKKMLGENGSQTQMGSA